jgi:hypothetical protein
VSRNDKLNGGTVLAEEEAQQLVQSMEEFARQHLGCSERQARQVGRNALREMEAYLRDGWW